VCGKSHYIADRGRRVAVKYNVNRKVMQMNNKSFGFMLGAVIITGVLTAGVVQFFSPPGEEAALARGLLNKLNSTEAVETATVETETLETAESEGNAEENELNTTVPNESENKLKDEADTLSAMRVDAQGEVAIGVSLVNLDNHPKDHLEFDVLMDTHSVDLDQYDLALMSQLSLDGILYPVESMEWRVTEGEGHHLRGRLVLTGPLLDTAILEVADAMELKIVELDGVNARVFRWESVELADSQLGVSHDS